MLGSIGQELPGLFILSTTVASIETRMILDGKAWTEWSFDQLLQHSREINKLSYSKYCNIQLIRWWALNIRQ